MKNAKKTSSILLLFRTCPCKKLWGTPEQLQLARQYSADLVMNSTQTSVIESVRAGIQDESLVAVIDTIQREDVQNMYLPLLQRGHGQIVYSGFTPASTWADMALLQQRELTAHFVSGWNRARIAATLQLMQRGLMRMHPLITHRVSFTLGPQMYQMIVEKSAPCMGITLDWEGA